MYSIFYFKKNYTVELFIHPQHLLSAKWLKLLEKWPAYLKIETMVQKVKTYCYSSSIQHKRNEDIFFIEWKKWDKSKLLVTCSHNVLNVAYFMSSVLNNNPIIYADCVYPFGTTNISEYMLLLMAEQVLFYHDSCKSLRMIVKRISPAATV